MCTLEEREATLGRLSREVAPHDLEGLALVGLALSTIGAYANLDALRLRAAPPLGKWVGVMGGPTTDGVTELYRRILTIPGYLQRAKR